MKLNLGKSLKDLEGKDIKDGEMYKLLANSLLGQTEGIEPVKAYDWAIELWRKKEIEIDNTDIKKLKEYILKNKGFTNLLKAQLVKEIEGAIESDKKSDKSTGGEKDSK